VKPPLGYIDAPFWYVLAAQGWAEELDRAAWIAGIIKRLGLVVSQP
jgi:hypothetical protein